MQKEAHFGGLGVRGEVVCFVTAATDSAVFNYLAVPAC